MFGCLISEILTRHHSLCVKVKKWEFVEMNGRLSNFSPWISAPTGWAGNSCRNFAEVSSKIQKRGHGIFLQIRSSELKSKIAHQDGGSKSY